MVTDITGENRNAKEIGPDFKEASSFIKDSNMEGFQRTQLKGKHVFVFNTMHSHIDNDVLTLINIDGKTGSVIMNQLIILH